ncbi:hypothetical protein AGMMS4956_21090 [Bacteroidia bacterium]|nr:hypothetical protein AGMMS4956_21090 [Bacteroidia bacterium]
MNSAAVIRMYREEAKTTAEISSLEVYEIAVGKREGNRTAALRTFERLGESLGDALITALNLVDGLVVIGGGVTGAYKLFAPAMIATINSTLGRADSTARMHRSELTAYDVESTADLQQFAANTSQKVSIPNTNISALYDPTKRTGIGISRMGDSLAMATGAYCFALYQLDK